MITSALFEKNPVLIEPVKQDQRANEREACTELESKTLHSDFPIRGNLYPSPHQEVAREGLTALPPVSPTSYDATSRRTLAADVIVGSSFIQRAYSLRSNKIENPTTDRTEALPGIFDLSAFCFGPHEEQSIMRGSASGQILFAKRENHV